MQMLNLQTLLLDDALVVGTRGVLLVLELLVVLLNLLVENVGQLGLNFPQFLLVLAHHAVQLLRQLKVLVLNVRQLCLALL